MTSAPGSAQPPPIERDRAFVAWACLPLRISFPGLIVDDTPERRFELQPSFRLAGPNRVTRIRCASSRVGTLVSEVREMAARHDVPILWTLDRDVEPADLARRLIALGLVSSPRNPKGSLVMVRDATLPVGAIPEEVHFVNGRSSLRAFETTLSVQDAGFSGTPHLPEPGDLTGRYRELDHRPGLHLVRADWNGVPAGAGRIELHPAGALLGGGTVRPQFRGRGVYTALVEERRRIALAAGVRGLAVHGGTMSAPILSHLGFTVIGRILDIVDPTLT